MIDRDIEADKAYFEAFKQDNPSLLQQRLKELRTHQIHAPLVK
jgi:hypothetical protein